MIYAIVTGLLVGFVLSLLTGPTFFSLLKISISRGFKSGVYFAFGVFLSDVIYITLAVFSLFLIHFEAEYKDLVSVIGGSFLFGIGIYYLTRTKVTVSQEEGKSFRNTTYFIKGFLMCMLNPMMLLYWLTISKFASEHYTKASMVTFFAACSLTILSSDILKSYIASRHRHRIKQEHILWMNKIAGLVISSYSLIKLLIPVFIRLIE